MADQAITSRDRLDYTFEKGLGAFKWIAYSGTATYFLTQLLAYVGEIDLPTWAVLLAYVVINTLSYAVTKYIEGKEQ